MREWSTVRAENERPDPVARTATTRTARSRRTRRLLVDGLRAHIRATGSFTANEISARVGCSPATFYSHFATKDDALAAAFESVLGDVVDLCRSMLDLDRFESPGVEAAVVAFVDAQADLFRRESPLFQLALSRLSSHRGIRSAYRSAEAETLAHLEAVVVEGQRLGLVTDGEPRVIAETVLVLGEGLNNPRILRPGAGPIRAEVAAAMVAVLTR